MIRASAIAALALASLHGGCKREPTIVDILPPRASATSTAQPVPVDKLLPGELPEGTEKAYGLALPRGFRVVRRFDDSIVAEGPAPRGEVVSYLRRRVEAATVEETKASVTLKAARVKAAKGPPLRLSVSDLGGVTEISLQDLTPPPVDTTLTEEERWRRAGLKPTGEVLDPTRAM
ncbi:MAG: hypothetical protein IT374_07415 [Polyangiaceae bacterium]|nr:hypothetical protein [Polyangiaceae bacterium]